MNIFELNIINIYGKVGISWLNDLPNIVNDLSNRWQLKNLKPVENLSYNYVLSGLRDNQEIILKLSLDHVKLNEETKALKAFKNYGAIDIIDQEDGALLLKQAIPGTSLRSYFPNSEIEAVEIACDLIKKLRKAPVDNSFIFLSKRLEILDRNLSIPNNYLEKARIMRDILLKNSKNSILLHGDFHHDNILLKDNQWIVIDPNTIIGDPIYEIASFIVNPMPELLRNNNYSDIIKTRIDIFAKSLDIEARTIHNWCYIHSCLAWAWALEDSLNTEYFSKLTEFFYED